MRWKILPRSFLICNTRISVADLFLTRGVHGLCILPHEKHRPFLVHTAVITVIHGTKVEGSSSIVE